MVKIEVGQIWIGRSYNRIKVKILAVFKNNGETFVVREYISETGSTSISIIPESSLRNSYDPPSLYPKEIWVNVFSGLNNNKVISCWPTKEIADTCGSATSRIGGKAVKYVLARDQD